MLLLPRCSSPTTPSDVLPRSRSTFDLATNCQSNPVRFSTELQLPSSSTELLLLPSSTEFLLLPLRRPVVLVLEVGGWWRLRSLLQVLYFVLLLLLPFGQLPHLRLRVLPYSTGLRLESAGCPVPREAHP